MEVIPLHRIHRALHAAIARNTGSGLFQVKSGAVICATLGILDIIFAFAVYRIVRRAFSRRN